LAITALLGLSLAIWARRHFGSAVALFTLALYSVDPNVIAYGRYLKNDILVTSLGFVFWIAWSSYLEDRGRRWKLLASGMLLGLALATKFSAVFLIPAALLLAAVHRWRTGQPAWHRVVLRWLALTGIAACVLLAAYGPDNRKLLPMSRKSRMESRAVTMADTVNRSTASGRLLSWLGRRFGWRDHALATGLGEFAAHATAGHEAYLLGQHSRTGWWYDFPVAFLVKTPVATLAAVSIAVALGVVRAARHSARKQVARLRDAEFSLWTAAVPIAVYVPICLLSRINTGGARHLLPIYPFLFVLVSAGILASGKRWAALLAGALILCAAAETFSVYPHETAFFNRIVGGPANGPRYLVDSNIDWGQDLKKLVTYVNRIGVGTLCLAYFGTARPEHYGLNFIPLHVWLADPSLGSRCLIAISATPLMGVYVPVDRYAWLRAQTPVARIGYSIYLYDAARPPQRGAN
jgi:4-amino-4-deoxy-L-arabinose transferase-like glycosyltransferase